MRKKLLLLFVVMLLFFAMLGHNVTLILSDKLSEISTVEMSAVVDGVSSNAEGDYIIWVKDPDGQLRIPAAIARNMDVAEITALQPGTMISFRIPISQIDYFPETQAGTIVALKTDHELLSIEDYNRSMYEEVRSARVVGAGVQIILLALLIYLIYRDRTMLRALLKRIFGR